MVHIGRKSAVYCWGLVKSRDRHEKANSSSVTFDYIIYKTKTWQELCVEQRSPILTQT